MKTASCPKCGNDSIFTGVTPLPDGNGAYEQYRCLACNHGFMLPERPGAAPHEIECSGECQKCAGAILPREILQPAAAGEFRFCDGYPQGVD